MRPRLAEVGSRRNRRERRQLGSASRGGHVIVLGHAGHWLSALIYAGPVLIVAALVLAAAVRQRREADEASQPREERKR